MANNLTEGDADGLLSNGHALNTCCIWITGQIYV